MLGLLAGTLFYKLGGEYNQQKMNSIRALAYVPTMTIMLIHLVQLPVYMLQRPIYNKYRNQRFFRTSSYIVANGIVNLPQTLLEVLFDYYFFSIELTLAPIELRYILIFAGTILYSLCSLFCWAITGRTWGTIIWVSGSLFLSSVFWFISLLLTQHHLFNSRSRKRFGR